MVNLESEIPITCSANRKGCDRISYSFLCSKILNPLFGFFNSDLRILGFELVRVYCLGILELIIAKIITA